MELTTQNDYITSVVLFWPRKDKEGNLKAEDVVACKICFSHVHDKQDDNLNLSHLKMHHSTLHGFVISEWQHSLGFVQITLCIVQL